MTAGAPPEAVRPTQRIPALDALRGVAVLMVVFYHLTRAVPDSASLYVARSLTNVGWAGVDLFFVLSGFLITGILLDSRASPNYFTRFYARRTRRIFPVYFGTLAVLLFLVPLFGGAAASTSVGLRSDQWWYWSYLSNWIWLRGVNPADFPTALHFWSLAIEEQFYLIWPLLVWRTTRRQLTWIALGLMLAAPAIRTLLLFDGAHPAFGYHLTITRMDALAIGALGALLVRDQRWSSWFIARARNFSRWTWLTAYIVIVASLGERYHPLMASVGYTVLALAAGVLVVRVVTEPRGRLVGRLESSGRLRWLGTISYGLYVYHYAIRGLLEAHGWSVSAWAAAWGSAIAAQLAFYVVAGGLSLLAAHLSWHWIESRILGSAPPPRRAPAAVASNG